MRDDEPAGLSVFADSFCPRLRLEDGETPLVLYPEERVMLRDYFEGVLETVIIIGKKNGKTSLLAALALFHLITTRDAACYIGASSRDQATLLYKQAVGFVERSPGFFEDEVVVKSGYRLIRSKRDAGEIRVLAADANTADGVTPTLAIVDELHRHKSGDLYGVFRDGLGPRNGQMLTISTAGEDETSPLGIIRAAAHALPTVKRRGAYRYARKRQLALHEWSLEPDDDREDMALVKRANPAPWQTIQKLTDRFESPSMTVGQWARFACGVWGIGDERAFARELILRACRPTADAPWRDDLLDELRDVVEDQGADLDAGEPIAPGSLVTLGFDGARRQDATGLVVADVASSRLEVVGCWERPPNAPDDWEVDEDEVDEVVDYALDRWKVWRLNADPPYWESAVDRWAGKYGKEVVVRWWTNRLKAMAYAIRAFHVDLKSGELTLDGDPRLVRHLANAVKQTTNMRDRSEDGEAELLWVIRKDGRRSPRKIDLGMAGVLAHEAKGQAIRAGALKRKYRRARW